MRKEKAATGAAAGEIPVRPPKTFRKKAGKIVRNNWEYVLMCLPVVAKTILFSIVPLLWLLMAFQTYNGIRGLFGSEWVGFQNFEYFFLSKDIWHVIGNTLWLNFMMIALGTPISIGMALFMREIKRTVHTKIFQTIYFVPYLISWVIVQYATSAILSQNGLINNVITALGGTPVDFFAAKNGKLWPMILFFCNLWKGAGYSVIMYYSALQDLDPNLLEAAELDGANRLQRIWYIAVPHLGKVAAILLIMSMGGIFHSDFGLFWFIPKNDTYKTLLESTEVLDTYIYELSINNHNYSVGTAIGLIQSIVGTLTLLLCNQIVKRIDKDSAYI